MPVLEQVILPTDKLEQLRTKLSGRSIPSLDGIRGLAALIVVAYHYGWPPFSPQGSFGVLVFFVLSGFLITWLLLKESSRNGTVSLRKFYSRRFLRIFPAFYFYWIVNLTTLYLRGKPIPWGECLSALFYVGNYYYPLTHSTGNVMGMTWSLAVEEQFYLLWPFVFVRFHDKLRQLSRIVSGVILAIWIYREFLHFGLHVNPQYVQYAFESRFDHLMIGALVAVTIKRGVFPQVWERVCTLPAFALTVGGLLISITLHNLFGFAYSHPVGFIVEPFLIAAAIVQCIYFSDRLPCRGLNSVVARYLGRISYPIYLYHALVMALVVAVFPALRFGRTYMAAVLGCIAAASVSYLVVERPFLKMKERFVPTYASGKQTVAGARSVC
jgi:peptidoglycan/LPS O-acetylase OafA/YrhL